MEKYNSSLVSLVNVSLIRVSLISVSLVRVSLVNVSESGSKLPDSKKLNMKILLNEKIRKIVFAQVSEQCAYFGTARKFGHF